MPQMPKTYITVFEFSRMEILHCFEIEMDRERERERGGGGGGGGFM